MTGGLDETVLARVAELSGVGFWVIDLTSNSLQGTEITSQWLGRGEPGPIPIEELDKLIHPDHLEDLSAWYTSAVTGASPPDPIDYRLKTPAGGWRWVQSRIEIISRDDSNKPLAALVVTRDITMMKVLQRELSDAEARWTSLVDEAPVGISLVRPNGQLLFVNRLESSHHQGPVVGRNWKEFLPSELNQSLDLALHATVKAEAPQAFETYRTMADGSVRHFENHLSPVRNEAGTDSVMVISLDVTEEHLRRRRQRKEARRNEILLSLHTGVFRGREAVFRLACFAAKELSDASEAALYQIEGSSGIRRTAESFEKAKPEPDTDTLALVRQAWVEQTCLFSYTSGIGRMAVPFRDTELPPSIMIVEKRGRPFVVDDGQEVQDLLTGLWQLIVRKEKDATLQQLSQAIECTPSSILVVDRQGEIVYANRKFFELSGYLELKQRGVNLWALQGDLIPERSYDELKHAIQNDSGWQGELPFRKPDGTMISEFVAVSPVRGGSGTVDHFVVVKEDITERKAAQELAFQAQKMETLGQVAAGVAHDFNNLLAAILGYNEMIMRRSDQPDNVRTYSEKITRAGERASKLVSGMLAAARRQVLATNVVELGEFLDAEEPLLSSLAKPYFKIDQRSASPVFVNIDTVQMGQVIMNLVTNARDAIQEKGSLITLSYGVSEETERRFAWLRVQDDGPGIPEDIQQKIFEPFFTTKMPGKGTGLGLAMVQGIVQQHRGRLILESQPGSGTQFTVLLPLEPAP